MRVHIGDGKFRVVSFKIVHQTFFHTVVRKSSSFKLVGDDNTLFALLIVNTNEFRSELLRVDLTHIAPRKRHAAIVAAARALALTAWENKTGMRMGDL